MRCSTVTGKNIAQNQNGQIKYRVAGVTRILFDGQFVLQSIIVMTPLKG